MSGEEVVASYVPLQYLFQILRGSGLSRWSLVAAVARVQLWRRSYTSEYFLTHSGIFHGSLFATVARVRLWRRSYTSEYFLTYSGFSGGSLFATVAIKSKCGVINTPRSITIHIESTDTAFCSQSFDFCIKVFFDISLHFFIDLKSCFKHAATRSRLHCH